MAEPYLIIQRGSVLYLGVAMRTFPCPISAIAVQGPDKDRPAFISVMKRALQLRALLKFCNV